MIRKCMRCGVEFETQKAIQKFCSKACGKAYQAKLARERNKLKKVEALVCGRSECCFYTEGQDNHCGILREVVEPCNFYKDGSNEAGGSGKDWR